MVHGIPSRFGENIYMVESAAKLYPDHHNIAGGGGGGGSNSGPRYLLSMLYLACQITED